MIETADFLDGPAISFARQPLLAQLFADVADTATPLTIVYGAGVSMNSSLPSWNGLLDNMAQALRNAKIAKMALSDRADALRRAERLLLLSRQEDQRAQSFEPVRNALYPADIEPQPGEMAKAIARLAAVLDGRVRLMTTNFDPLVEAALEPLGGSVSAHSLEDCNAWEEKVMGRELAVMHLHGLIRTGWRDAQVLEPVILSESHFLRHGRDVRRLLAERLSDSTVLFLGVSLTDPNLVGSLFDWAASGERDHKAYALVVPEPVPGAESDEDEFEYNRRSAEFLNGQLGLRPVFLKSYAQVTQVVSDLALCCSQPERYQDTEPLTSLHYGLRFERILEATYSRLGVPETTDTPSDTVAADLTQRLAKAIEAQGGLLSQLREWSRLRTRGIAGPPEEFGVFLWLRSRDRNSPGHPYSLSLVANSVYAYRSSWAGRRVTPVRRDSSYAAALAVYRGATTASNLAPSPGFSMWRGVYAVPLAIEAGVSDAEIADVPLDRVTIGCITLNTSRSVDVESSDSPSAPPSVLHALRGEDSDRLNELLINLAAELISD